MSIASYDQAARITELTDRIAELEQLARDDLEFRREYLNDLSDAEARIAELEGYRERCQAMCGHDKSRIRELEAALRQIKSIHDELHQPCAEIMAAVAVADKALASTHDREAKHNG